MEGNLRPGTPHPLPAANVGCNYELTRSNSDASLLTAENCKDILRRSANVTPVSLFFILDAINSLIDNVFSSCLVFSFFFLSLRL